jgi:hypothetical protein
VTERPTFSITIETANLETAEAESLRHCLATLALQEVPPEAAKEISLIEDGGLPSETR